MHHLSTAVSADPFIDLINHNRYMFKALYKAVATLGFNFLKLHWASLGFLGTRTKGWVKWKKRNCVKLTLVQTGSRFLHQLKPKRLSNSALMKWFTESKIILKVNLLKQSSDVSRNVKSLTALTTAYSCLQINSNIQESKAGWHEFTCEALIVNVKLSTAQDRVGERKIILICFS